MLATIAFWSFIAGGGVVSLGLLALFVYVAIEM